MHCAQPSIGYTMIMEENIKKKEEEEVEEEGRDEKE